MWTTLRLAHIPTGEQNQKKRTNHVLPKPDNFIRYRHKLPGGFPAARCLSQLTVCAAERVTGSPLVAASRVTASVFGSSATAELMRLRVANSIVFFLNRR
jgi:hypothetical protein